MKKLHTLLVYIFFCIVLFPSVTQGQEINESTSRINLLTTARNVITDAGNCSLITLDKQGRARARTMDPFPPAEDFTIWFGTNTKSRKVTQIKNDPRVTLYYFDKPSASYVMIYGRAEIIDDPKSKTTYWKDQWSGFYPDYPRGYALIKVTPEWLEVISESRGISGDSVTWQPPMVTF